MYFRHCLTQITLKLEPDAEVARRFGAKPGPLDEIQVNSIIILTCSYFEHFEAADSAIRFILVGERGDRRVLQTNIFNASIFFYLENFILVSTRQKCISKKNPNNDKLDDRLANGLVAHPQPRLVANFQKFKIVCDVLQVFMV